MTSNDSCLNGSCFLSAKKKTTAIAVVKMGNYWVNCGLKCHQELIIHCFRLLVVIRFAEMIQQKTDSDKTNNGYRIIQYMKKCHSDSSDTVYEPSITIIFQSSQKIHKFLKIFSN